MICILLLIVDDLNLLLAYLTAGERGYERKAASSVNGVLDPIYTGTDPYGSVPVWVQISLPFTLDLLDPYRYGSAIRTILGSLSEVYPFGSVPVEVQCKRLDLIQTGTDRIEHNNISLLLANFTIVSRF